jgi:hypothetical protein
MPELAKYHTFNTVIIGAGVALRWRGDTGASPFPPVALQNDGRKNKCMPRGGFWDYPPRFFSRRIDLQAPSTSRRIPHRRLPSEAHKDGGNARRCDLSHSHLFPATTNPGHHLASGFPALSFDSSVIVSAPQPWRWKESCVVHQQPP